MKPTFFKGVALGAVICFLMLAATAALGGTGVGDVFNLGEANTVDATSSLSGTVDNNPQLRIVNDGAAGPGIRAFSTTDRGVFGRHQGSTGTLPGVEGLTSSTDPNAVALQGTLPANADPSEMAVRGSGGNGIGVFGQHGASTGDAPGVLGFTASISPNGAGVVAKNSGGGPALNAIVTDNTVPPLSVNSTAEVANLNADELDGKDSSSFLSAAPGAVGSNSLATGAVTNSKVAPDVIRHVAYNVSRTSGGNASFWNFGSMQLFATCYSQYGVSLGISNHSSGQSMRENFSWVDTGNAAHDKQVLLPHNTSASPMVKVSNGSGTGSFVAWLGSQTVTGTFTYFADANHCEFYANPVQAGPNQNQN